MTLATPVKDGTILLEALADELVLASQMLADLAYDLGGDEATLRRHMTSLQKIDEVTQMQLAIAKLLRDDDPINTLHDVSLEEMKQRLLCCVSKSITEVGSIRG